MNVWGIPSESSHGFRKLDRIAPKHDTFIAMETVPVRLRSHALTYEIRIEAGLLRQVGVYAKRVMGRESKRAAVFSNPTVFGIFGPQVEASLQKAGFQVATWLMKDGERHKSMHSLGQALAFLSREHFERSDLIVALGGGVVGDLAGFAAAIYMRGIPFINLPTTLLAQIDASVGGKTGINLQEAKNLVGAFHHPRLVLIDTETLQTLSARDLTAGWCEAVKQGAVGNRQLFADTVDYLRESTQHHSPKHVSTRRTGLARTIAAHCRFKASVVANDEREAVDREDARSRKILNFGHTTAHALETVTRYRRFRHGEAVGYGMLVAAEISKNLGMLAASELELLRAAVRACGKFPRANDIDRKELLRTMTLDKKSFGGTVKWVLLEEIGTPRIVDGSRIPGSTLQKALEVGLRPI